MKSKVYINILTRSTLCSTGDGYKLLDIWKRELPNFLPEKIGNFEPLKTSFVANDLESALKYWAFPFLLRRKNPKLSASIFMGGGKVSTHGWIHIIADFKNTLQAEIVSFVKKISVVFHADFGFVHLMTRNEFGDGYSKGVFTVSSNDLTPNLSVSTYELKKNIPNIYWGTVFGKAYSELFGTYKFDKLSECCSVERLLDGMYYIQLSPKISDLETNFEEVNSCRQRLKKELDSNAFFNPQFGPSHQYLLPNFSHLEELGGDQFGNA